MKKKFLDYFMRVAELTSELSSAQRLKVGAILVKNDRIISLGYNGTPSGWDNNCEDRIYNTRFSELSNGEWIDPLTYKIVDIDQEYPIIGEDGKRYRLKTKPEVLHAEMNCLMKVAQGNESSKDSTLFVTHAPCLDCAKAIYQANIGTVFYKNVYRTDAGIEFLKKCGLSIEKLNIDI